MSHSVKILIIRFSSIGDIVLTTPVIRCLKNQLEGEVEVHYLTKKAYTPLLEENPYLSKVYSIEKSTNELIADLQKEEYDYIVDLHKNLRSSRVKKRLAGLSFSFEKLNLQKWLMVNLKINKLPSIHIVDRYLESVKALGVINDQKGLDYFMPKGVESTIADTIPANYVALVLSANHATKKMPQARLKELVTLIKSPIVLVGGKEDRSRGKELADIRPERIFNFAGKTNLHQSAYLLKMAQTVISPDTGMMHIAAAFQKKIISIWGNTIPNFGMYPYLVDPSNSTVVEVKDLNCRPCSKIGFAKCPKGHFKCMNDIDLSKITESI